MKANLANKKTIIGSLELLKIRHSRYKKKKTKGSTHPTFKSASYINISRKWNKQGPQIDPGKITITKMKANLANKKKIIGSLELLKIRHLRYKKKPKRN